MIAAVEDPFRKFIDAAGCYRSNDNKYDIDPEFFEWRFLVGSMRLGLADRRALTTPTNPDISHIGVLQIR